MCIFAETFICIRTLHARPAKRSHPNMTCPTNQAGHHTNQTTTAVHVPVTHHASAAATNNRLAASSTPLHPPAAASNSLTPHMPCPGPRPGVQPFTATTLAM